jgi:hypothetical protein
VISDARLRSRGGARRARRAHAAQHLLEVAQLALKLTQRLCDVLVHERQA